MCRPVDGRFKTNNRVLAHSNCLEDDRYTPREFPPLTSSPSVAPIGPVQRPISVNGPGTWRNMQLASCRSGVGAVVERIGKEHFHEANLTCFEVSLVFASHHGFTFVVTWSEQSSRFSNVHLVQDTPSEIVIQNAMNSRAFCFEGLEVLTCFFLSADSRCILPHLWFCRNQIT